MKKLPISERDQNLLIIVFGILIVVLVYFYGYQKLNERTAQIKNLNKVMQDQIALLNDLTQNQARYEQDTAYYIEEAKVVLDTFPVDVFEEDQLLYTEHLATADADTFVSYLSTPRQQVVGLETPAREDLLVSSQDVTGQIAANAYQPDGSVYDVSNAMLYATTASMTVQTSYNGLKRMITDVVGEDLEGQRRIVNLVLAYDEQSGGLAGTMDVTFYAMEGLDRVYIKPDAGTVPHGLPSIFGSAAQGSGTAQGSDTTQEGTEEGGVTTEEGAEATEEAQEPAAGN